VNLTYLPPGSISAPRHFHSHQDEFVYILEGTPILVTSAGEMPLRPGMCAGFKAGAGMLITFSIEAMPWPFTWKWAIGPAVTS